MPPSVALNTGPDSGAQAIRLGKKHVSKLRKRACPTLNGRQRIPLGPDKLQSRVRSVLNQRRREGAAHRSQIGQSYIDRTT